MKPGALLASFVALQHRPFRKVWIGNLVWFTGSWMQITGRGALIYEATGSTAALGSIYFLSYIPQLLLSQFAGLIADRYDRRKLLICGQIMAICGALAMAVVAVTDTASVVTVGAISILIGVVQAVTQPAQQAIVPSLVPREHLLSAITLNSSAVATTRVFGPLLAGVVVETFGIPWLFWLNAASFSVILGIWVTTRVPRQPPMEESRARDALAAGARFARRTPAVMVALATTFVICGIGNVYQSLGLAFTTDVLAGGSVETGTSYYTYFQSAMGVGALVGILGLAELAKRRPALSMLLTATGLSACLVLLGRTSMLGTVLVIGLGLGFFFYATQTLALNVIQHRTPDHLRGRVLALHTVAFVGTFPVTSIIAGWLADVYSISAVLSGTGLICLAYCIPLIRWSRHLTEGEERHVPPAEEAEDEELVLRQESGA